MDNELSQIHASKEKLHTQHYGAHSGTRAGLSDYHDGGRISHYGGNEDNYPREDEETEEQNDFDSNTAYGNDNESGDEEDYGKYHSGL